MQPIQILAIVVMVFGIVRTISLFRERRLSAVWFVFWVIIWGGVGVVAFVPKIASQVADFLGVGRGIDVLVYVSILLLFYLIFRIYLRLESIERNITKLVREIALHKK